MFCCAHGLELDDTATRKRCVADLKTFLNARGSRALFNQGNAMKRYLPEDLPNRDKLLSSGICLSMALLWISTHKRYPQWGAANRIKHLRSEQSILAAVNVQLTYERTITSVLGHYESYGNDCGHRFQHTLELLHLAPAGVEKVESLETGVNGLREILVSHAGYVLLSLNAPFTAGHALGTYFPPCGIENPCSRVLIFDPNFGEFAVSLPQLAYFFKAYQLLYLDERCDWKDVHAIKCS